jgi:hypothetical protein
VNHIVKLVYLLSLGAWAGTILFFTAIVVRVARQLEPKQTSVFLRGIFPQYYLAQIICGAGAFLCALTLLATGWFTSKLWGMNAVVVLAVITGINVWLRQGVLPQMAKMRDRIALFKEEGHEPDKALAAEWSQLHRLTVIVNLVSLAACVVLLALGLRTVM